jgi:pyruvate/2-oxoglutarate/acetoin dehydrogenase E1 component
VRNTPLSELAILGTATGAAMCGARPVAEIMHVDFIGCGFDIVLNQMSKMCYKTNGQVNVPLVIRTQSGRGRSNGCTQSQSLEALFTHIPGLKVVMPSTPADAKGLLKSAIRDNNPVIFIEHKGLYQTKGEVPEEEYLIPLGQADVKREGKDLTIFVSGMLTADVVEAAKLLAEEGIDAEVINIHTIKPIDRETVIASARKTGTVLTVENHNVIGGLQSAVLETLAAEKIPVTAVGVQDRFGEVGKLPYLREAMGLTVENIVAGAKKALSLK